MTAEERADLILEEVKKETGTDPVAMFYSLVEQPYVSIHGPEHHIIDGACLLQAFANAKPDFDVELALIRLKGEGLKMPGAMCGLWGICGAIASMGAALALIDGTGPLSTDGTWGEHMTFTAAAVSQMAKINGPRCCKRDALIAFTEAVRYLNAHHGVQMTADVKACTFSEKNKQCIKDRCPYYKG